MMSPFGNVLNTRESYSRFYQKLFTEVESYIVGGIKQDVKKDTFSGFKL